jgi:hypothetical protein
MPELPDNDTYPYDGGPDDPVPEPANRPRLQLKPKKPAPAKTRFVSSPRTKAVKIAYRAYGE